MKAVKNTWSVIKETFSNFMGKKVLKLSAALAYYTVFSLPALLIIAIWISELVFKQEIVEGSVYKQISSFVGSDAALQIQETMRNAAISSDSYLATIIGIATLVIGSTSVFS